MTYMKHTPYVFDPACLSDHKEFGSKKKKKFQQPSL